jgi:hypothetical protein
MGHIPAWAVGALVVSVLFRSAGVLGPNVRFLRTVRCSPVRANQVAHALKLPRVAVLRRLQELVKDGYVERVGNAYAQAAGAGRISF